MALKQKTQWISPSFRLELKEGKKIFLLSGVALEEIVKTVPLPFYVYDATTIKSQYENLRHAFSKHEIDIFYAVKPNTSVAILDGLRRLGAGFDVGSEGELLAVAHVGADPKKVSFAGPVKTDKALSFALEYGVSIINAESEHELQRINILAKKKGIKQKVAFRVNIEQSKEQIAHQSMAGGSTKFGIDEDMIDSAFIKRIQTLSNIALVGVHVYSGNMLNAKAFLANVKNICRVAETLNQFFPIRYLDFGGGLAVPYTPEEEELDLSNIAREVGDILRQYPFLKENKTKLCIEPGRFLVAQSGIYVARVEDVKQSHGKKIVLVDGGIHHMIRPSLLNSYHPIYNLSRLDEGSEEKFDVGGSLCTPIDFLGKEVLLPKDTQRGDLLGVFLAGAYGWSEAMPYFMSNATAAEVLVGDGKFSLIRKSENPKDFLTKQIVPNENLF